MSRNWKYEEKEDNRNYLLEARNLVKGLRGGQLYEMYEIVIKQLQRNNSPTKDKELSAVRDVIEQDRGVNAGRLRRIKYGYKSDMASTANPRDGYTKTAKKEGIR